MLGYYGQADATAEVIDARGWLHTGDVAYMQESGHVFVVDRLKDTIITGGYNVYPAEIERVIAGAPGRRNGRRGPYVADDVKGELATAYVVLRPGMSASQQDIVDHCRPSLAAYKLPRGVRICRRSSQDVERESYAARTRCIAVKSLDRRRLIQ